MKKTLLLSIVCFLFALQNATAYTTQTKLQLRAFDNSPIMVNVDGQNYGAYTNSQSIENLSPGFHQIQVFALVANPYSGNSRQLIYSGGITLPQYRALDAVVNPGNDLQIVCDVALLQPVPVRVIPTRVIEPVKDYGPTAMCEREFNEFMCSLNKQWFDNTKVEVAKQMLNNYYVTANQVKRMLDAFTFESYKLEIAKYAYNHTVDPERYYVVNDAFTFSSSISELICYTNSQRGHCNSNDRYSHNSGDNHGRNHQGYAGR